MYIVAFGASGQVGRHFVVQAARRGHQVLAVVRAPVNYDLSPEQGPRVRQRLGDVQDGAFVSEAVRGADVVWSGLGLKRKSGHPWAALASPPDLASQATGHILVAMSAHGVRRLAAISTAGAAEAHGKMNLLMRILVAMSNVGAGYRDLARMEVLLRQSDREWIAVRPTRLTDGPATGRVRVLPGGEFAINASIPRADVAGYMLDQIERPHFDLQLPTITVT